MKDEKTKIREIFNTYWPLAISWLLMAADTPAITAFISRMNDPKNVLAAHGTAYPLVLLIETPVLMLTSVALSLCIDAKNYRRIRTLMIGICLTVTFLHALVCVPPVFSLLFEHLLNTPPELLDYCREELLFVIPWSGLIGYRRFNQGVLIRCGRSRKITVGTILRVIGIFGTLFTCLALKDHMTGARAAGLSLTISVAIESFYNAWQGHLAAKEQILPLETAEPLISWDRLRNIVLPLLMTNILNETWMFIGSAAISRMIDPVTSLAVWPVMTSLLLLIECWGYAVNETALAQLVHPEMKPAIRRFIGYITCFSFLLFLIFALPPVNELWYSSVSSLKPELVSVSKKAFPIAFLIPLVFPTVHYYQAVLMNGQWTRPIFESLLVFLAVIFSVLGIGVLANRWMGVYVMMTGRCLATAAEMLWLRFRTKQLEAGIRGQRP